MRRARCRCVLAWSLAGVVACNRERDREPAGPLVVYNAAAIARPMRAVLDSFQARTGARYEQETAASLELALYALAATRVHGRTPRDSVTFRGRPILFGVSIPSAARRASQAERFVAFLLSADGRRILRQQRFDALERPEFVGGGVPAALGAATGR